MTKCPCKGCLDRKLLCHGMCQKYQEWKKELERMREALKETDTVNMTSLRKGWRNMRYGGEKFKKRFK